MSETPSNKNSYSEEINFLDYLDVIFKRRRMIIRNSLLAGLIMLVLSFLLPKTYTATTTLLPPDEGDQNGLRSLLLNSPVSLFNVPGIPASSSDIFVEILKSRTVAEAVLSKNINRKKRHKIYTKSGTLKIKQMRLMNCMRNPLFSPTSRA
ncbi:hypothetical protein IH922_05245 [candidate division KSB1 bacterium]|nr:hypothetical protein [candidate division KSB1 bacterium]